jgi:hypothetical protein
MNCAKCGKPLLEESQFCMYCGNPVGETTTPVSDQIPEAASTETNTAEPAAVPVHPTPPPAYSGPPPIETRWQYQKYDEPYEKPIPIALAGIVLGLISLAVTLASRSGDGEVGLISGFLFVVSRVVGGIWVAKIAREQNRDVTGWVIFTLLLPVLAMIIIGFQRKLYAHPVTNPQYDQEENGRRLYNKAVKFYQENRYDESYRFALKALECDPHSAPIQDLLSALHDHVNREP